MPDQQQPENFSQKPRQDQDNSDAQSESPPPDSQQTLSAEEQMALYEKELKENDWGHQPC